MGEQVSRPYSGLLQLVEDNAGGLYLWLPGAGRGWSGLETVNPGQYDAQDGSAWCRDVDAIRSGDVDSWTLPTITEEPEGATVAWDEPKERGALPRRMGRAARAYVYGPDRCTGHSLAARDASGHAGTCPACGYNSSQAHQDAAEYVRDHGEPPRVRGDRHEGGDQRAIYSDGDHAIAPCACGLELAGGNAQINQHVAEAEP